MSSRPFALPPAFVVAFAVAALASPGLAAAQSQRQTIYASVVDRDGAPVTTFGRADFVVREDGVAREVVAAAPADDPLRIAVLVDTSQAMQPHVADLRSALRAFLAAVRGHEVSIVAVGERPTILADYTRDPERLEAAVGRVFAQSGSGAYLLDAIVEVSERLRSREPVRSAIVAITAEGPELSDRDHQTVVDALARGGATLHSFVVTRGLAPPNAQWAREREFAIARGTRLTGGRREDLLTSTALGFRLESLAAELRNQYRVEYARPASLLGPGTVRLTISDPALVVRASRVPHQ